MQLLDAARKVFVEQGYHAAAMDDIAERAGVSKPVLYQHFPGKLDLYLALLDEHADELVDAVREALASTTDNKARVAATMAAYFAFIDDDHGAFRLVFESDLTSEPAVSERVERTTHACAELVSAVIAEDAGLSRDESMLLAVALIGTAQVSARWWLSTGLVYAPPGGRATGCDAVLARHPGLPARRAGGSYPQEQATTPAGGRAERLREPRSAYALRDRRGRRSRGALARH